MKVYLRVCWLAALSCCAWFAAPAQALSGEGAIAVIVAPGHARRVKQEDLLLIYKRKQLFWPDGKRIQPVNMPVSNALRREFSQTVLGASPEELEKYWNDMYFHGIAPPYVLSSSEAVLRFVAETPEAIGYVSFCNVGGRAKVVLIITPDGHVSEDVANVECGR